MQNCVPMYDFSFSIRGKVVFFVERKGKRRKLERQISERVVFIRTTLLYNNDDIHFHVLCSHAPGRVHHAHSRKDLWYCIYTHYTHICLYLYIDTVYVSVVLQLRSHCVCTMLFLRANLMLIITWSAILDNLQFPVIFFPLHFVSINKYIYLCLCVPYTKLCT